MDIPSPFTDSFPSTVLALSLLASVTIGATMAGCALVERLLWNRTRLFDVPAAIGVKSFEVVGTLLFIPIFAGGIGAVWHLGLIATTEFSWLGAALTLGATALVFDLYYYGIHRAMHSPGLLWLHRWHHRSKVSNVWTSFSLSPGESALWVVGFCLVPVGASALGVPIVLEAWTAWLVFILASNVPAHVNVELVPAFVSRGRWVRLATHPVLFHALHHARYDRHYAFFLNAVDEVGGTVWDDYPSLHARVLGGEPLTRLLEQGTPRDR